jgi:hypothetical protein
MALYAELPVGVAPLRAYDVIHAHVHHYDGVVLRLAARHYVPIRIAHSHNNTRPAEARASWPRRLYLALMKRWIQRYATHRLAVSRSAADDLFGHRWTNDPLAALITWGLDFTPWALRHDRTLLRSSLGLPEDALVLEEREFRFLTTGGKAYASRVRARGIR